MLLLKSYHTPADIKVGCPLVAAQLVEDCLKPLTPGSNRDLALDTLVCVDIAHLRSLLQTKQTTSSAAQVEQDLEAEQERMCEEARRLLRKSPSLSYNVAFEHIDNLRQVPRSPEAAPEKTAELSDMSSDQLGCSNLFSLGLESDSSTDDPPVAEHSSLCSQSLVAADSGAGDSGNASAIQQGLEQNDSAATHDRAVGDTSDLARCKVLAKGARDSAQRQAVELGMREAQRASDRLARVMKGFDTEVGDGAPAMESDMVADVKVGDPRNGEENGARGHSDQSTAGSALDGRATGAVNTFIEDVEKDGRDRTARRLKSGEAFESEPAPATSSCVIRTSAMPVCSVGPPCSLCLCSTSLLQTV